MTLQDRRSSHRHPVLLRTTAVLGRERFDVVCVNISPTGAFLTTRYPPPVGAEVTVELRAGGMDSPLVHLLGMVTRTSLTGSQEPVGFGVQWRLARCDLGPEPLYQVLRQLLRIALPGMAAMSDGLVAEYDFSAPPEAQPHEEPHQRTPRTSPMPTVNRNSSVHQAIGVWSPPMHRPSGPRETVGELPRAPSQHVMELDPPTPIEVRPRLESAAVAAVPVKTRPEPVRVGVAPVSPNNDRSQVFDPLRPDPSQAVGRSADGSQPGGGDVSQSWPVYSLGPGERRLVSDPEVAVAVPPRPLVQSTVHRAARDLDAESIAPPPRASQALHNHPVVPQQPPPQPAAPQQAQRRAESGAMLAPVDLPITVLRQNQFITGQLTGIAPQLACVVTQAVAPDLDEPLVIHLPVRVDNAWRTVQLFGKLLQIPAAVSSGKRFVMHIERVDEGRNKGAFQAFLQSLGPL